jgi:large subunit ribosomal protein L33
MAKSDKRIIIKLVSTGLKEDGQKTGYFKTTYKNKTNTTEKLELKKFDPRAFNEKTGKCGMHVLFKEEKIK